MRQQFENLYQLMNYYLFIKYGLRSEKAPLAAKDEIMVFNAWASRSTKEEKFAFVGDVNNFLDSLETPERIIFKAYFFNQDTSFENIARWFIKNGSDQDRRFRQQRLVRTAYHATVHYGTGYFKALNYIQGEQTLEVSSEWGKLLTK